MNPNSSQYQLFCVKGSPACETTHAVFVAMGVNHQTHWFSWDDLKKGLPFEAAKDLGFEPLKKQVPFVRSPQAEILQDSLWIVLKLLDQPEWVSSRDALLWRTAECDLGHLLLEAYLLPKPKRTHLQESNIFMERLTQVQKVASLLKCPEDSKLFPILPGQIAWSVWESLLLEYLNI